MRELKEGRSSKGAQAREQAGKKAGRQASTRKAFSRSHALEGLVLAGKVCYTKLKIIACIVAPCLIVG